LQAQIKTAQASARPTFLLELAKPTQKEKLFLKKFPTLQKKLKTQRTPRQSMTYNLNIDNGLQGGQTRTPAPNRRLAQWRVKWLIEHSTSHQLLWCIDSFVLRNPPLRQAPNRWQQP
jgi:hypothetical protein